nr:MAG TPA: Sensor N-terminal transmembrane domain [Caudoviricetes sp.]
MELKQRVVAFNMLGIIVIYPTLRNCAGLLYLWLFQTLQ